MKNFDLYNYTSILLNNHFFTKISYKKLGYFRWLELSWYCYITSFSYRTNVLIIILLESCVYFSYICTLQKWKNRLSSSNYRNFLLVIFLVFSLLDYNVLNMLLEAIYKSVRFIHFYEQHNLRSFGRDPDPLLYIGLVAEPAWPATVLLVRFHRSPYYFLRHIWVLIDPISWGKSCLKCISHSKTNRFAQ